MYKRFCVRCGREGVELVNGLCRKCYEKTICVDEGLKVKIKFCTICGRFQYRNKWYYKNELLQKLEKGLNLKIKDIIVKRKKIEIISSRKIDIEVKKTVCKHCIRYFTNSYNYIIQIRGDPLKSKTLLNELVKMNLAIKQIKESKHGYDLYLDMNYVAFKRIIFLFKSRKYDILISRKLITYDKQKGRNKYRVTVRVKLH